MGTVPEMRDWQWRQFLGKNKATNKTTGDGPGEPTSATAKRRNSGRTGQWVKHGGTEFYDRPRVSQLKQKKNNRKTIRPLGIRPLAPLGFPRLTRFFPSFSLALSQLDLGFHTFSFTGFLAGCFIGLKLV